MVDARGSLAVDALQAERDRSMNPHSLAMFGLPGGTEWIVIGIAALLIFGRRLPDVARSVGRSIVEFKKGLRDVKDDIDTQARLDSKPPTHSEGPAPDPDKPNQSTTKSPDTAD